MVSLNSIQKFNFGVGAKKFFGEVLFLLGDNRKKLPLMAVMFIAVSIIDLVGISLIGPYIAIIIDDKAFGESFLSQLFKQIGLSDSQMDYRILLGFLLIIVFFSKGLSAITIHKAIVKYMIYMIINLDSILLM